MIILLILQIASIIKSFLVNSTDKNLKKSGAITIGLCNEKRECDEGKGTFEVGNRIEIKAKVPYIPDSKIDFYITENVGKAQQKCETKHSATYNQIIQINELTQVKLEIEKRIK